MKRVDPFYSSREWRQLRDAVIRRDKYLCRSCGIKCLGKKRGYPSPHVDHIIPRLDDPSRALDPTNLQTLCGPCHSKRSASMRHRPGAIEIGPDGYPI